MVPLMISDEQFRELGLPHRYVTQYLRYSKDNCWTSGPVIGNEIHCFSRLHCCICLRQCLKPFLFCIRCIES